MLGVVECLAQNKLVAETGFEVLGDQCAVGAPVKARDVGSVWINHTLPLLLLVFIGRCLLVWGLNFVMLNTPLCV